MKYGVSVSHSTFRVQFHYLVFICHRCITGALVINQDFRLITSLCCVFFLKGLYQKAEALYYMGEFEFALVFYHRGQKLRPQIQEFRLGIQKAQEAIENSVGSK